MQRFWKALLLAPWLTLLLPSPALGVTWQVAESGGDFTSIQPALDVAAPGDVIQVRSKPTPYFEKLVFPTSGDAISGPISLEAYPLETPVLDGTGVAGSDMILIENRSWVRVVGFEIRNNLGVDDGSGVRVLGAGSNIEIRDNEIHDIRGNHAMGITVYGTEPTPISELVIDGNLIHDCEPARSEALTLNGNVTDFEVTNNVVRDVNSIGIDFIGGETDIQPDPTLVARNGVCRGNTVIRARASYGGGFGAGIYVDGGRDIVIENNLVTESDLGIEIGAENSATDTTGVVVRNNVVHDNDKTGIVFGGYAASVGRVRSCEFRNNTLYHNDTLGRGFGELWIQWADGNLVRNNAFFATGQNLLLASYGGNVGNILDHNLWFVEDGAAAARFIWNNAEHTGFGAYQAATGQDANSGFSDPLWVDPAGADFHLGASSPAVDSGDPTTLVDPGETDLDGAPRSNGPEVDVGADEVTCGDGVQDPGEPCDDGNAIEGDGCDSNCTLTGCGNGIQTAGEACDDGNLSPGDCCDASCQFEAPASPCDDGDGCSNLDACDGAGVCTGSETPEPVCKDAGKAILRIRDDASDDRDLFVWKWLKGDAAGLPELGDPINGTGYSLCLYDRTGGATSLAYRAELPSGGACGAKPCWKSLGSKGFRYKDVDLTPDGLLVGVLRTGGAGAARILIKGRGEPLDPPALPLVVDPQITVQLKSSDGTCWGASHDAPLRKNESGNLKALWP